jgi:hypothetical protein
LKNGERKISDEQLAAYFDRFGLDAAVKSRISELFWVDLYIYAEQYDVDPTEVLREISDLETGAGASQTKPAAEFRRDPLKGLWHKHFFSARFVPQNIANGLRGGALEKLVDEVLDANKSEPVTADMIAELSRRAVHEPLENRADQNTLTGEWIVFAKHGGQNYYLCLNTHRAGDQMIMDRIRTHCTRDFPFLDALKTAQSTRLDESVARYQPMVDAMQTPQAKAAALAAFQASPEELGRAAVAAAAQSQDPAKRSST